MSYLPLHPPPRPASLSPPSAAVLPHDSSATAFASTIESELLHPPSHPHGRSRHHHEHPGSLSHCIAIVTGASGGMGPAVAAALAARGVGKLVLTYYKNDAAPAVAAARASAAAHGHHVEAIAMHLDMSSRETIAGFVADFKERVGAECHYLVNLAASFVARTSVDLLREEEMAKTLAVLAAGPFWLCQLMRPLQWAAARRSGRDAATVMITPLAGEDGAFAASPAYTMAKAGVKGMVMQLSKQGFEPEVYSASPPLTSSEARAARIIDERHDEHVKYPYIRYNSIAPGPVLTAMLSNMALDARDKLQASTMSGAITTVEEVASAVAFVLIDATSMVGQTLQLSGGVIRR